MRIRAVVSLFLFAAACGAADLTWTSLMTLEAPIPMPGMPPSSTVIDTISGARLAMRRGDIVTIYEGDVATTVDYAKREYSRASSTEELAKASKVLDSLKTMPGFEPPKFTLKPLAAPTPGPMIQGVATMVQRDVMTIQHKLAGISSTVEMTIEAAFGKPGGWEAVAGLRQSNDRLTRDALSSLEPFLGTDAFAELVRRQPEGMPMRMRMMTKVSTDMTDFLLPGGEAMPKLPPMEITITYEVTSLSKTADLTMLEIPAGFREVPPPAFPTVPPPPAPRTTTPQNSAAIF